MSPDFSLACTRALTLFTQLPDVNISLLLCYCVFGYSLFVYIPVSIVAILALGPIQWLAWVLIMAACAWSTAVLGISFFFLVHEQNFKASARGVVDSRH